MPALLSETAAAAVGAGNREQPPDPLLQLLAEGLLAEDDLGHFGPGELLQLSACHGADPRWDGECARDAWQSGCRLRQQSFSVGLTFAEAEDRITTKLDLRQGPLNGIWSGATRAWGWTPVRC